MISVDELRAAGALDVPPAWRKSLGGGSADREAVERDLFSGLSGLDDPLPEQQQPASGDAERANW
ncbi:MAG: hypothetical protein ACT4QC_07740 [Planctomycetaceae bacterium]